MLAAGTFVAAVQNAFDELGDAYEEMKQKVEELEATLIKKDTDNTTLETSRLADQTTNCVYTRTPSIPLRKPSNKGGCPRSLIMGSLCYAWVCMGIYRYM